jgi:CSLREA domain-containing protein
MRTSRVSWIRPVRIAFLGALFLSLSPFALANTYVVTKTTDTNDGACDADCSLREAIIAANANPGADIITLPPGNYVLTIAGANEDAGATGDLDITDSVTINGAGAASTIVDAGGIVDRVFHILGGTVAFNGITIRNGLPPPGDNGAGIFIASGTLAITGCVISGNTTSNGGNGAGIFSEGSFTVDTSTIQGNTTGGGGNGGGIYDDNGALTITASTVAGNSVLPTGDGGGIYNNANGMVLTNVTITANNAFDGGGIFNNGIIVNAINVTLADNSAGATGGGINNNGTVTFTSSILADNIADTGPQCQGVVTDGGTNLQFPGTDCGASIPSADPLLVPLGDNGGPTQTMALGAGSPAIDAATEICPPVPPVDQRGITRPQGPACDIGAFELVAGGGPTPTPTATPTTGPTLTATPAGAPTATATPAGPTPTRGPGPVTPVPTLSGDVLAVLALALALVAILVMRKSG